ncbi:unnamed protein product [Cylicocyclus nassatus]|uniref:Uncharacterized protein n=1 Tax=Cylicocyclus nassatus TaxID=53992 RepID=A0AA36GS70_CYLNA|nr:unnamed protein product [Cylicocyclus nassatus]
MTIRFLFITLLLLVLFLIHFTYVSYLSLFQTLELTKEYGFVWKQRESSAEVADQIDHEESRESVITDYEKERQQLELFADVERWCSATNYTDHKTLPSPIELAKLHKKEDIWEELANTALIITNNFPWQSSIGLLQRMYQPYFKTTVFCGTFYPALYLRNDGFPAILTPFNHINLTEEEVHQGFFVYLCLVKASYLMRTEVEGKSAVDTALNLITDKYRSSSRIQKMWKRYQDGLISNGFLKSAQQQLVEIDGWCMSDFFYVPTSEMQYMCDLLVIFYEAKVFHEIAISKFLYTVPHNRAEGTQYLYLWGSDRERWDEFYSEKLIMIHPIKLNGLLDLRQRSRFCNTVVRTFKQSLFPTIKLTPAADLSYENDSRNSKEVEEK